MKKILIIDNSAMNVTPEGCCVNIPNGKFAEKLMELGNSVSWIQMGIHNTISISVYNLNQNGINTIPIKQYSNKLIRYIHAYWKVAKAIREHNFVYIYYPNSFMYTTLICKLFRKRFGLYIRGMKKFNTRFSYWAYKNASTVFTVSNLFTQQINYIAQRQVARTIRPLLDLTQKDIQWNREYNTKSIYEVMLLSRIAKDKGLMELIEACNKIKSKGISFHLSIVGSGEYLDESKQLVEKYGLNDEVKFYGAVYDEEKKKQLYLNADIYILPTYHEGFPRTLYEAMIYGTPIITTMVGGIPALMKHRQNCLKIESCSSESIVEQLLYAFDNYNTMVEFAKNAFTTVAPIVDSQRLSHAEELSTIINKR